MKWTVYLGLLAFVGSALGRHLHPHIIGGQEAAVGAWPWQGSLQYINNRGYWDHTCGCSLISATWVITAGHCVGAGPGQLFVVMGLHERGNPNLGSPQAYYIDTIYRHQGFDPKSLVNDISLIRLRQNVNLNRYVQVVPMAPVGANFENQWCYITGWGVTTEGGGSMATRLREAYVPVVPQATCYNYWPINNGQICIGLKGSRGSCNGDSGGPLVCNIGGKYHLAGLTSYGLNGCYLQAPTVYTRVSYYRSWIAGIAGM